MASNTSDSVDKYHFIAEPDSALQCIVCLDVAEDPWQHGDQQCGRLLCEECLEKLGRDKPCPNCRGDNPQYFKDHRSKRDITALRVKCSNVDRVCEWEGTVGTLQGHVATCGFTLVPCPKECKDDNNEVSHFMRKDLDQHLEKDCPNRDHECEHKCGEKGTYAHITLVHDKTCKRKTLPCPNAGCGKTMERQRIDKHIRTKCPYTVIPCKYQGIGCAAELKRRDMAAHEQDDQLHLHMALETVNSLQDTVNSQQDTVNSQQDTINTLQDTVTVSKEESQKLKIYKLSDFQKKKVVTFSNLAFYTHPNGYRMTLQVNANGSGGGEGTHVTVGACILEGKYDAGLKWPFVGKYTFTLLNQLEDKNHKTMTMSITTKHNACVGRSWGFPQFIPHSALAHDPVKNTQYLKDDTLYFRLSVEVADHKPWLE